MSQFRHLDTFDHLRTEAVVLVLRKLVQGSTEPIHELLRDAYARWQLDEGVVLLPPEDMSGPEDARNECDAVLEIVNALYSDGHWIDAPAGCRSVEVARSGVPKLTWIGFCAPCRTTHMVTGREPDPDYDGSLPIPSMPLRRPRSRRTSR